MNAKERQRNDRTESEWSPHQRREGHTPGPPETFFLRTNSSYTSVVSSLNCGLVRRASFWRGELRMFVGADRQNTEVSRGLNRVGDVNELCNLLQGTP